MKATRRIRRRQRGGKLEITFTPKVVVKKKKKKKEKKAKERKKRKKRNKRKNGVTGGLIVSQASTTISATKG